MFNALYPIGTTQPIPGDNNVREVTDVEYASRGRQKYQY